MTEKQEHTVTRNNIELAKTFCNIKNALQHVREESKHKIYTLYLLELEGLMEVCDKVNPQTKPARYKTPETDVHIKTELKTLLNTLYAYQEDAVTKYGSNYFLHVYSIMYEHVKKAVEEYQFAAALLDNTKTVKIRKQDIPYE